MPKAKRPDDAKAEPGPVEADIPELDIDSLPSASDAGAGPGSEGGLWPDLPRVPFAKLLGVELAFREWRIMDSNKFQGTQFAVILFTALEDINSEVSKGDVATTSTGSGVITDRLERATGPFKGRVQRHEDADYYEFAD